ncbi:hypothetical protein [Campylobacter gastrosuis]|uniref:Type II secretion system protein n=1 Tax=Campylobacter gastrosuis TaxID=2974576 RepID=A0ABT7HQN4_9BACT|nr:hypothetical protein [Campylobacter gastrosuis]MDL0089170.1 hypothetical protein [Campylobacter gastrosuis]
MKRGFALIIAIVFVVLIASLGVLAMILSTTASKQSADMYVKDQVEIYAKSFTEYAVLRLLTHDFNTGCLDEINGDSKTYAATKLKLNAKITYYGKIGNCTGISLTGDNKNPSSGTVMIDVFVTNDTNKEILPIRYHKRTLQKL